MTLEDFVRAGQDAQRAADELIADAERGMCWWNSLSRLERLHWLEVTELGVDATAAAAWEAYKAHVRAIANLALWCSCGPDRCDCGRRRP